MKNLFIFAVFILALVFVQFVKAQTIDEIVSKNLEGMGGKEKLASLKTVKLEGTMSVQGTDINIVTTKSHLKGMRMDIEVMGIANYQMVNTTGGVVFMPISGMTEPQDMDADQFKHAETQLDIQGVLLNYKDKGTTIESLGIEEAGGTSAHKLKVTYKNGKVGHMFIDTKTGRVVKSTSKTVANGAEQEVESLFSDYKQNADGYWFPYTITSTQGTIVYDKITTNQPVDESLFKK